MLTCGSLFAGIGGFDLGFERAGIKTIWQVEIDEYCRRVLARHFPDAKRFADIRDCGGCGQFRKQTANRLTAVDIIAGGFPCQDISISGSRLGLSGERSSLWWEMYRVICEVRPRYVVVENVAELLKRGIGDVIGALAALGYDTEWDCLPAFAFGAPHFRDRVFIVGYTSSKRLQVGIPQHPGTLSCERSRGRFGRHHGPAWDGEPELALLVNGIPDDVAGASALGNAVVPQIAEWIGRRIVEAEERLGD